MKVDMRFKLAIAVLGFMAGAWAARAASPEKGKGIYSSKCASCHGKDGKGNPAMSKVFKVDSAALNLADDSTLGKKDEELAEVTAKGKGKMPAFAGKMKPEEIDDVVAFVKSISSAPASGKSEAPKPAPDLRNKRKKDGK